MNNIMSEGSARYAVFIESSPFSFCVYRFELHHIASTLVLFGSGIMADQEVHSLANSGFSTDSTLLLRSSYERHRVRLPPATGYASSRNM